MKSIKNRDEKLAGKLQLLLNYLMQVTRPDGTTPLIGDDDGGRALPLSYHRAPNDFRAALATGAVIFERGDYKFVAGNAAEEMLWLLGDDGIEHFADLSERATAQRFEIFSVGRLFRDARRLGRKR